MGTYQQRDSDSLYWTGGTGSYGHCIIWIVHQMIFHIITKKNQL